MSVRRAERQEWPDPNSNTAEQLKATPSESSDETKDETERSSSKNIKSQTTRPKPRRVLPPLKRDDEFVDLQNVIDKAAPVYEFTHGYMDSIILKCDKCKRHARGSLGAPSWTERCFEVRQRFLLCSDTRANCFFSAQWNGIFPVLRLNLVQAIVGIHFVALSVILESSTSSTPRKLGSFGFSSKT